MGLNGLKITKMRTFFNYFWYSRKTPGCGWPESTEKTVIRRLFAI